MTLHWVNILSSFDLSNKASGKNRNIKTSRQKN